MLSLHILACLGVTLLEKEPVLHMHQQSKKSLYIVTLNKVWWMTRYETFIAVDVLRCGEAPSDHESHVAALT